MNTTGQSTVTNNTSLITNHKGKLIVILIALTLIAAFYIYKLYVAYQEEKKLDVAYQEEKVLALDIIKAVMLRLIMEFSSEVIYLKQNDFYNLYYIDRSRSDCHYELRLIFPELSGEIKRRKEELCPGTGTYNVHIKSNKENAKTAKLLEKIEKYLLNENMSGKQLCGKLQKYIPVKSDEK